MNKIILSAYGMELKKLVVALFVAINPNLLHYQGQDEISTVVAKAVSEDPKPPVYADREEDAAVMAYWAYRESSLMRNLIGDGGRSFGPWQLRRPLSYGHSTLDQGITWLATLHLGKSKGMCPSSPGAVMWGAGGQYGCHIPIPNSRPGWDTTTASDERVVKALHYLEEAKKQLAEEEDTSNVIE